MPKRFLTLFSQPGVRARALLKLSLVVSALFILLDYVLITPPPSLRYTFVDTPQPALAPGENRVFIVKVYDNLSRQPVAYSRFEVTSKRYAQSSDGDQTAKLATVQTNEKGEMWLPFLMPRDATANDAITILFHPLDEPRAGDYQQRILVLRGLTIRFDQWQNSVYQGEELLIEAMVLNNDRTHEPTVGAVVTVTQRLNKQEGGWQSNLQEVMIARTDEGGRIKIAYQVPDELQAGDQIELHFSLNDGFGKERYTRYLYIPSSLAIELVRAPAALVRGSKTELLIHTQDIVQQRPLAQVTVTVWLRTQQLFTDVTDKQGLLRLPLEIPADYKPSEFELTLMANYGRYQAQLWQSFMVIGASANLLLTTDKLVYQPSQVIHTRLLLNALTLKPAAHAGLG